MTDHITETFQASDGVKLFYRRSNDRSPKRVLVFHGLIEHSAYYPAILETIFPEGGVDWVVPDLRGHGKSEGERNQIDPERLVSDTEDLLKHLGWENGSIACLAHSFGGLLALYIAGKHPNYFKALLLSGPFLGFPDNRSFIEVAFFMLMASFFPKRKFQKPVPISLLTHDAGKTRQREEDRLIENRVTLGSLKEIHRMQKEVSQYCNVRIPLLMLMAGEEKVVSKRAQFEWFYQCINHKKNKKEFRGLYHDLFNEIGNEMVYEQARKFFTKVFQDAGDRG